MKLAVCFALALAVGKAASQELIFEDSFDSNVIDESKWTFEKTLSGGGDWQFQWFDKDPESAFIHNGVLHLRPTLTADKIGGANELFRKKIDIDDSCTSSMNYGCSRQGTEKHILNPIRSASIRSKQSFKFGTLEIRAKLPCGDWLRPSVRLLPVANSYGEWPASGEIDLLESRGNLELTNDNMEPVGVKRISSTLHFGPSWDLNGWEKAHFSETSESGFHEDCHIFKLIWNENEIQFFVDSKMMGNVKIPTNSSFWQYGGFEGKRLDKKNPWREGSPMAPFDQEFFVSIGLAVGGVSEFFSDSFTNHPHAKPWRNNSPSAPLTFWKAKDKWYKTWTRSEDNADFQIDYIKFFSK